MCDEILGFFLVIKVYFLEIQTELFIGEIIRFLGIALK